MPYTTRTDYKGYTLGKIMEIVLWHLGQVANGQVSYARFPKSLLKFVINKAQKWVNSQAPAILKYAVINTEADRSWYKAPPNMLPAGIAQAYYVKDSQTILKLELLTREELDKRYPDWKTDTNKNDPMFLVPSEQMYGNRTTFEVYPRVPEDGTWSPPSSAYAVGEAPMRMGTVTGTASSGSRTTMIDTGASFENGGIKQGMFIWNVTKSAYKVIRSVQTIQITHATLATNYSFESGDRYEIAQDYIGVVCDWDNDDDDQYIYAAELASISTLGAQAGNIILEYYAMPMDMVREEDYPQIKKELQDALVYKAVAILASMGHEKVRLAELSAMYHTLAEQEIQAYRTQYRKWPYAYGLPMSITPTVKEVR